MVSARLDASITCNLVLENGKSAINHIVFYGHTAGSEFVVGVLDLEQLAGKFLHCLLF